MKRKCNSKQMVFSERIQTQDIVLHSSTFKNIRNHMYFVIELFSRKNTFLKSQCEILFKIQNKWQKWIPWRIPLLDSTFQDLFPTKSEVGREKNFAKSHMIVFFFQSRIANPHYSKISNVSTSSVIPWKKGGCKRKSMSIRTLDLRIDVFFRLQT